MEMSKSFFGYRLGAMDELRKAGSFSRYLLRFALPFLGQIYLFTARLFGRTSRFSFSGFAFASAIRRFGPLGKMLLPARADL